MDRCLVGLFVCADYEIMTKLSSAYGVLDTLHVRGLPYECDSLCAERSNIASEIYVSPLPRLPAQVQLLTKPDYPGVHFFDLILRI